MTKFIKIPVVQFDNLDRKTTKISIVRFNTDRIRAYEEGRPSDFEKAKEFGYHGSTLTILFCDTMMGRRPDPSHFNPRISALMSTLGTAELDDLLETL